MIEKLDYLLALSRERHFSRAAQSCGISQPTLSAAIKQLEASLGVLLVNRGSRFQGFTPEGDRVLEWARRIVSDSRAMREEARAARVGLSGHLRIAAIPTALASVARLTAPFHVQHPAVSFTVSSRSTPDLLAELDNLEQDVALGYVGADLGRMRAVPLYEERYCAVLARAHALAAMPSLDWADVADLPLCLLTPAMQNRQIVDARLLDAGAAVTPSLESDSIVALLSHVGTGEWASVLSVALVEAVQLPPSIATVPILERLASPVVGLIYPQREPLPPHVAAFVIHARRSVAL